MSILLVNMCCTDSAVQFQPSQLISSQHSIAHCLNVESTTCCSGPAASRLCLIWPLISLTSNYDMPAGALRPLRPCCCSMICSLGQSQPAYQPRLVVWYDTGTVVLCVQSGPAAWSKCKTARLCHSKSHLREGWAVLQFGLPALLILQYTLLILHLRTGKTG